MVVEQINSLLKGQLCPVNRKNHGNNIDWVKGENRVFKSGQILLV